MTSLIRPCAFEFVEYLRFCELKRFHWFRIKLDGIELDLIELDRIGLIFLRSDKILFLGQSRQVCFVGPSDQAFILESHILSRGR